MLSATHIKASDAGIMIRYRIITRRPCVDVDMLVAFHASSQGWADVDVIKCLRAHIIRICIAFFHGRAHDLVQICQPGNRGENRLWLDKCKLVEVPRCDDGSLGIES